MDGMSAHADMEGLIQWLNAFEEKPGEVFLVHGNDDVRDSFRQVLKEEYGYQAEAPFSGSVYDLASGRWLEQRAGVVVTKTVETAKRAVGVYARLLAAGERLLSVIRHNEGGANKDLAKFADQINSLCDKWDR